MPDLPLVVVVGGLNMDIQARSGARFRAGDSNPGTVSWSPGGVGRNMAHNLVALGLRVELLTVLGDDLLSRELEASCAALGIGLAGALRRKGGSASQYLCLLDVDGSLAGAVAAMDSFEALRPEVLAERSPLLDSAALILVDANIPEPSIGWLARRYGGSREGGPFLGLDPVSAAKAERARPWLGSFRFAKPNRAEAAILAGPGAAAERDPRRLAIALRATGLREVFISLAEEGLYYEGLDPEAGLQRGYVRPPLILPPALEPVNVSGAGDAACAALAWALVAGSSLAERAGSALAAAMLTAASTRTVAPEMSAARLAELARGVIHEPLS